MAETKDLQVREKHELKTKAEQIKPGLMFTPTVDIFETNQEITLLADMPGVTADDINIDIEKNVLTLTGNVKPWESADESDVLVEFEIGKYYRQFTLSQVIDQAKIKAELKDGVLRLNLPKVKEAKPRQIKVKAT